jgi:hypothetical protein
VKRRQVLLEVFADAGPPIEPVWSATDLGEALLWCEALQGTGTEASRTQARCEPRAGRQIRAHGPNPRFDSFHSARASRLMT